MAEELVKLARAEARMAAAQAAVDAFERDAASGDDLAQAQAAAERGADADVASARSELAAAEALFIEAARSRKDAQAAAGPLGALLAGSSGAARESKWSQPVDDAAERVESAKAAAAAGAAGVLAAAPLAAAAPDAGVALGVVLASCALFGVVYRYAVRRDVRNAHLKGGVVASFGLVRGLAQAELFLAAAPPGPVSFETAAQASLLVGEAVVTFALAAAAVEACFARGAIAPFPVDVKRDAQ